MYKSNFCLSFFAVYFLPPEYLPVAHQLQFVDNKGINFCSLIKCYNTINMMTSSPRSIIFCLSYHQIKHNHSHTEDFPTYSNPYTSPSDELTLAKFNNPHSHPESQIGKKGTFPLPFQEAQGPHTFRRALDAASHPTNRLTSLLVGVFGDGSSVVYQKSIGVGDIGDLRSGLMGVLDLVVFSCAACVFAVYFGLVNVVFDACECVCAVWDYGWSE